MPQLDKTHDPRRESWVASANGHPDFPIQNLPVGVFSPPGAGPRGGIAIGEMILDLRAALEEGLFTGEAQVAAQATDAGELNAFFALGANARKALRARVSDFLDANSSERARVEKLADRILYSVSECVLHVPARVGDYTDFYVGIHHATNVGKLFRPDSPLLPNYKHVPIGYHGRASSIVCSGATIRRPAGQMKPADRPTPVFGPCERLDYELELGIWIGQGNELGTPIPIAEAESHIAGFCLLNDWSARDIQSWEYQPLGPFLSKNFGSTISPWVITPEALAPFRCAQVARPSSDPQPLPYLLNKQDQASGAFNLDLELFLSTTTMRDRGIAPHRLSLSSTRHMYWTTAQLVAHHTSGGCNLRPGDLFGSGTISAPDVTGCGSMLETTDGGKNPIMLASGEERSFLQSGDEIIIHARTPRLEGLTSIGFGECRGVVG